MIYFVTNNTDYYNKAYDNPLFSDIIVLNEEEGKKLFYKKLGKKRILANDIEATGLNAYYSTPLLWGLGTKEVQFAFDWTINVTDIFEHIKKYNIISLGHNLLYDYKMIKVHTGVLLERTYDTMIADQRIWLRLGYGYSLAELTERYLKKARAKEIRNEFINANIKTFKITPAHLYYLRSDLADLFDIRKTQVSIIKQFKMEFLIYGIEFPFIHIIAESELKGFVLNEKKWIARTQEDKDELFKTQCDLDVELRRIRDLKAKDNPEIKTRLVGGRYDKDRVFNPLYSIFKPDGTTTEIDLFGEPATKVGLTKVKKKVSPYPNNINYKSPTEVVKLFAKLEEPLYNKDEVLEVPKLTARGSIIGTVNNFSLKADKLEKYILLNPNSIMRTFLELYTKQSKLETAISNFGDNFISKINRITGRLHTAFRQLADTGRMKSGGGKQETDKPNFQNIPADNRYRNCFTTNTAKYSIASSDYTGAELLVMASHAQDFRLIELNNADMHSHMATLSWRAIYYQRALVLYNQVISGSITVLSILEKLKVQYRELKEKAENFTVSKKVKDLRNAFKPMTFGIVYGMYAKKAGETLNITKEEGQIVINVIKKEIPQTIKMVEAASDFAERFGYVILNDRTNSRMWFAPLIKQIRGEINKKTDFKLISDELSAARNGRIQGTQADFVKEATVVLWKHIQKHKKKINGFDATILAWIHDEIVDEHTKKHNGKSYRWMRDQNFNPSHNFIFMGEKFNNYPEWKTYIMETVANRYLKGVTIKVETEVKPYWKK